MQNTRPSLAEIRRINKRNERLQDLQDSLQVSSIMFFGFGFLLLIVGAFLPIDIVACIGCALMGASPVLALVALFIRIND